MSTHYSCGIDFHHELDQGCLDVFTSIEELKQKKPCWKTCGIVEFEMNEAGEVVSHKQIVKEKVPYTHCHLCGVRIDRDGDCECN